MTVRETADAIETAALTWVWRLDEAPEDAGLRAELEAWLAADQRRRGAYLKARAAWSTLDRVRASPSQAAKTAPSKRPSRRAMIGAGGLLAASLAGVGVYAAMEHAAGARLLTKVGEIRRTPLADGSQVVLNTDTRIAVAFRAERRQIKLDAGEAWFEVAKDAARPFVVEAGPVRVRAVGTAFSVRRRDGGAEVLVTEGIVEAWVQGAGDDVVRLSAGEAAFLADDVAKGVEGQVVAAGDADRRLAWRDGKIDLRGETLGFAVAEFNRYNDRKLRVDDPTLAGEPLYGVFRINDPDGFGATAAAGFGARMIDEDGVIVLTSR